ncbi:MAG: DUF748 domain-containing protein [Deltaproteobacteria bacterium]|nr:DUF748 domain-containing protein [Deltaproteobacteria bacterium]
MTETVPPMAPRFWRRLLARRRYRVVLGLVLLAVIVRIALPAVLRRVVVAQADEALVGRVEIDDIDLAPLTGGLTLHGLRVFSTEATPVESTAPASTAGAEASAALDAPVEPVAARTGAPPEARQGPPGSAPVFSAKTLAVDITLLPLLHRTVEVQRITLDGVAVSLDRAKDGTVLLPTAVPSNEPPQPPSEAPGWGVLIQSVALHDGRIGFRDFAVSDPPQRVEVALSTLDARQLALRITKSGLQPGKVTLDVGIRDGTLHLEASIESLPAGPAYESHVVLANVPIADSRLYLPKMGWSGLTGYLDADLIHRFESQGAHTAHGTAGLRDLDVRVAELDDPALSWKSLRVDLAGIDFVAQHAEIKTVTLDGPRLMTRPSGSEPLPVLRGLLAAAAEKVAAAMPTPHPAATATIVPTAVASATPVVLPTTVASPAPSKASPEGVVTAASTDATSPPPAAVTAPTVSTESAKPWTWAIGKVSLTDGHVQAIGGDGPLGIDVTAEAAPVTSVPEEPMTIQLKLVPSSGGTLDVAGALTQAPLGFDGTLETTDLKLPPLTRPVATAPTRLLKDGRANLDLAIVAGVAANAPPDGVRISGTIGLADVDVAGEDPSTFAVRWKQLTVDLGALTAPGVLAPGGTAAPNVIDAAVRAITLTRPDFTLVRTATGIALPAAVGGASPSAAPLPPAAAPAAASPPAHDIRIRTNRVAIEAMRVATTDTTVQPFFHSTLDPIDLHATEVGWPGPSAKDVKLVAKSADGAILTITGNVAPERTRLVAKLASLLLEPFNPYATSTGYGIGGGTAGLESAIAIDKSAYDTKSRITLNELDVRSGEGNTLFLDRFGMPLDVALSLLTDLRGNIVLDLPIKGDAKGMRTDVGTLIANALTRAILNAVTSPLKLIGAVARIGDKPASLAPPPLAFAPGRATLVDGEVPKLAPVASLLAEAPGLTLHLRGEAGNADRRWIQEDALRAKLEKESSGLGALRYVGERGARKAVLAALTARAEGTPGDIPAEHQPWFDAAVAEQSVDDDALRQLASARATEVRTKLASGQGVDASRVVLDEPAVDASACSVVAIGLGTAAPKASGSSANAPPTKKTP